MPLFTTTSFRPRRTVHDDMPDQLQGQLVPDTKVPSYIMPPKHLSLGRAPGCKQSCNFLDLPGEVRNHIYGLVLEAENYEVVWLDRIGGTLTHWKHKTATPKWHNEYHFRKGSKNPDVLKARWEQQFTKPDLDAQYVARRRGEMMQPRHSVKTPTAIFDAVTGPAAMLRVSKQIHAEFAQLYYGAISVSFQNHKIMAHWIGLLTPVARKSLTKLYVNHRGYGEPKLFKDLEWKNRHDRRWEQRLKTIVEELPNLKELHLGLRVLEKLPGVDIDADWAQPLKVLRGLKHLTEFELKLDWDEYTIYNNDKWAVAAERVKRWIMGRRFNPARMNYLKHRLSFPIDKEGRRYNPKTGEISLS